MTDVPATQSTVRIRLPSVDIEVPDWQLSSWIFDRLNKLEERIIGLENIIVDLQTFMADVNTETNRLAALVKSLQGQIVDPAVAAQFDTVVSSLQSIGANPSNPIPNPVPPATP